MTDPKPDRRSERRKRPRVQTRLHGRLLRGREKIRVRVVDVSEGGLCLLSPIWIDPKKPITLSLDVPGKGIAQVQIEIWHIRREKSSSTAGKIWVAGAVLRSGDDAFTDLLATLGLSARDGARAPVSAPIMRPNEPPRAAEVRTVVRAVVRAEAEVERGVDLESEIDAAEPRIFRLRCRAKGSPRTRVLTIAAESEEHARQLALQDLGSDWDLIEVGEP